jgi:cell division protein FtsQ
VLAVLGSGLFGVDDIRIEGAEHTTAEELAPMVADLEGSPVLRVDTEAIERELEQLPWVEDARVTTQFPGSATIELRERTPAAAFQGPDGTWRLIDDTGRVLAVSAEAPVGFLPILGSDFPNVEPGVFAPSGFQGAARLARSLTATVAARATSITVTPDGSDLRLTFTDGTEVRFGPATELVQKLVRLETKLDDLGDEQVTYLDVSTNEIGQG